MQFKLFVIPVTDSGESLDELNRFVRSHRILEESHELVAGKNGSVWHFCIKYLNGILPTKKYNSKGSKPKIDYREVLDEKTFKKFSKLREFRKQIATDEAIPAFAVFTDKELSEISKLSEYTESNINKIQGIGEKKTEKYGKRIIEMINKEIKKKEESKKE